MEISTIRHEKAAPGLSETASEYPARASCVSEAVEDRTALYRHYSESGELLYVGIALSPVARLAQHRCASPWFPEISTITISWYPTREAALHAEQAAIKGEGPRFNVVGARPPSSLEPVTPIHTARKIHRLSARGVEAATKRGYHCDGGGLYLLIGPSGTKSWVLRYQIHGRRREMGLGPYPSVSLAQARSAAVVHRQQIARHLDPLEHRSAA